MKNRFLCVLAEADAGPAKQEDQETQEVQETRPADGSSSECPLDMEDGNRKTLTTWLGSGQSSGYLSFLRTRTSKSPFTFVFGFSVSVYCFSLEFLFQISRFCGI